MRRPAEACSTPSAGSYIISRGGRGEAESAANIIDLAMHSRRFGSGLVDFEGSRFENGFVNESEVGRSESSDASVPEDNFNKTLPEA